MAVYPDSFEEKIEFNRVREILAGKCQSAQGLRHVEQMGFLTGSDTIRNKLTEVQEYKTILMLEGDFTLGPVPDTLASLGKLKAEGRFLETEELKNLRVSIDTTRLLVNFFAQKKKDEDYPALAGLAGTVKLFPYISERIDKVLNKHGRIRDNASRELQQIRSEISRRQSQTTKMMNRLMQQAQASGLADGEAGVTIRNGRPVIPVEASHKRKLQGIIHDQSSTGKTIFIEPAEAVEHNNEIKELEYGEKREIIRILTQVTDDLRPYREELEAQNEFLGIMDFISAKARFARDIEAEMPELTPGQQADWKTARHPLLYLAFRKEKKNVVPLDISLDEKQRILVISGPNAGGKSVCLKTVGLLQYMLQCGLLIPVHPDSRAGIFEQLFIDIGDEQSIENDLSTYSSHLRNLRYFVGNADSSTLLLIDEFGTGTEPVLGGAIAEAVLEQLNKAGCYGVITTHYSNLKHYAASADGIENAAMMFDSNRMQPLFRLTIGQPGSSYAFEIARSTGLPEEIIKTATARAGEEHRNFDRHLREIIRDKKYWEAKRDKIRQSEKRLQHVLGDYSKELESTEKARKNILRDAQKQADEMLAQVNKKIENTIREIREAQAEKEKTKKLRKELDRFREEAAGKAEEQDRKQEKQLEHIKAEEKKVKERRIRFGQLEQPKKTGKKKTDTRIREGDYVLMKGQETPGEVEKVSGSKAMVTFGFIRSTVSLDQLEKIDSEAYHKQTDEPAGRGDFEDWDLTRRKLEFRPEIDIRGQRVEEALNSISEYLDEAIMVEAGEVRILHGKGDGILRQVIREYLQSVDLVKKFHDEHVQLGGAGITVVHLDLR